MGRLRWGVFRVLNLGRCKLTRSVLWALSVLLLLSAPSCRALLGVSSDDGELPPVGVVETLNTLEVKADGGDYEIAARIELQVVIEPKTLGVFRVVGRGPGGGTVDDALIQLTVSWKDFVGLSPTSFGGRKSSPTLFGDSGDARRGEPLRRVFEIALETPQPQVLARRVELSARFHPLDVVGDEVRSAGARMEFPPITIETLARVPGGTLTEWFHEGDERDPAELFLRAAASPPERRMRVIKRLIDSLASLNASERDAGFGALHFLTGVTNGRSLYAWETWLLQQPNLDEAGL